MASRAIQGAASAAPIPSAEILRFPVTHTAEQRFAIMCAQMRYMQAQNEAESARFALYRAQHPSAPPWWDDPQIKDDVEANNYQFAVYHASILKLAETPAPTPALARSKQAVIGHVWLRAEGEFYDRLRQGVAADKARFRRPARRA